MITDDQLNEISPRDIVEASDTLERISDFVAEGARYVCHVRTTSAPTVYRILGNFYTGLYSMRDAAEYLQGDLTRAAETGTITHTNGGDADYDVEEARKYLGESMYHLREAAAKFEAAQQRLAWIGYKDAEPEPEQVD
jgi:hypothetical protein